MAFVVKFDTFDCYYLCLKREIERNSNRKVPSFMGKPDISLIPQELALSTFNFEIEKKVEKKVKGFIPTRCYFLLLLFLKTFALVVS